jgi:hypothetical protein
VASVSDVSAGSSSPRVGRGQVLLHIGVQKTGTTSLQRVLAGRRERLRELGVVYPGTDENHLTPMFALAGRRFGWKTGGRVPSRQTWKRLVREVSQNRDATVVVSAESLCEFDTDTARQVVEGLGGDNVHVVVTLRPLEKLMPSTWQQYLKSGATHRYDKWLRDVCIGPSNPDPITRNFWLRNDHGAVVDRWVSVTAPDRVTVVVLDPAQPQMPFEAFADLLGIDHAELISSDPPVANRSLTAEEAEFIRQFNLGVRHQLDYRDYSRLIRTAGVARLVEERRPSDEEHPMTMPPWAVDAARRFGRGAVDRIRSAGVHVIGDLEHLVPTTPVGPTRITRPTSVPIDVATIVLRGAVDRAIEQSRPVPWTQRARSSVGRAVRRVSGR